MSKRQLRLLREENEALKRKLEAYTHVQVMPTIWLPCEEPFRWSGLDVVAANVEMPEYVRAFGKDLATNTPEPYRLAYIQVLPLPEGFRPGDVILKGAE